MTNCIPSTGDSREGTQGAEPVSLPEPLASASGQTARVRNWRKADIVLGSK